MEDLVINERLIIPARELTWAAVRASGPGGQNVNKVSSKVDLRFALRESPSLSPEVKSRLAAIARVNADGELIVVAQSTRDQSRNLEEARERLAMMIRAALVVPKKRRATRRTRGSQERRLQEKKQRGELKKSRSSGD